MKMCLFIETDVLSTDPDRKCNSLPKLIVLCLSHKVPLQKDLIHPFSAQVSYVCMGKKGCVSVKSKVGLDVDTNIWDPQLFGTI